MAQLGWRCSPAQAAGAPQADAPQGSQQVGNAHGSLRSRCRHQDIGAALIGLSRWCAGTQTRQALLEALQQRTAVPVSGDPLPPLPAQLLVLFICPIARS
jgi:hypothetical protein